NLAFVEDVRVKQVRSDGTITTLAGTALPAFGPENVPATTSGLPFPEATAFDSSDNLLIASDYDVRQVTASSGIVTKLAGGTRFGFNDSSGPAALFGGLIAIATVGSDVLVADPPNHRIRRISGGVVATAAGTDIRDAGPPLSAFLD